MRGKRFVLKLAGLTLFCSVFSVPGAALAQPAPTNGYAQIGKLNMYYEIHGRGEPLLILHGGGSTIQTTYGAILPELAKTRMVIAPEQQGHGHTADVDRPLSYRQMADDTAALLKQLGHRKVDVIGFSNGGGVAMELAIRYPELVRKLVIGSAYHRRDAIHPRLLQSFRSVTAKDMPEVYRKAYMEVAPHPEDLAELTPKLMQNMLGFEGWDEAQLASIKASTMIIQGNNDVMPLKGLVEMASLIPNAQVVVLPGGHGTYLGEVMAAAPGSQLPQYATGIILEFLNSKQAQ
jgi:pimeloyl-ACP methyl ester carboxylesterase